MSEQITELQVEPDGHVEFINQSDIAADHIIAALEESNQPEVAALMRWGQNIQSRRGGLIERDKFVTPRNIYDQMRVAQEAAADDDVVSGVLETTEALAFSRMSVQCDDEDEEDIWNQILEDVDMETRIREMWKELFTVSQFYVAVWWTVKDYKVKGKSKDGIKRKKQFRRLRVPESISLLDPLKIVPVGNFMFNQEQLAWMATRQEATLFDNVLGGLESHEMIKRLLSGRYEPSAFEQQRLGMMGIDPHNLFLLNPQMVFRVTATRPQYRPFADVRMKSIFELLDLKNLLREMDRAHLLGASNFIVLVKKGSEKMPAKNEELAQLSNSMRTLARMPLIVGDHRLEIEIVTPKVDFSLQPEKYNTIDARITARLFQMFMTGNFAAGAKGDDSLKLVRIVARGLEARRSHLKKSIEQQILDTIYERNDLLTEEPTLEFHPNTIAIDFDPGLAAFLMDLLDRHVITYGTVLEQIDLDEEEEYKKRLREIEKYDDTFKPLTPLTDPQQQQDFQIETLDHQNDLSVQAADKQHKNTMSETKQQQNFLKENPHLAQPTPVAAPTAKPAAAPTSKKAATVKKKPANADPKSAGRSGGGNRSGGGAAPGSGQGQPKDPRRKATD